MERSEKISELAKALVAFQLKNKTIGFDANNPFFKSKYATLTTLVENTRHELANCGLVVSQLVDGEGSVTTILMHTSGEFISSTATLKSIIKPVKDENGGKYMPSHPDPQSVGSAITYTRRYAYAAILGLVSDEDDDGNAATHKNGHEEKPINRIPATAHKVTDPSQIDLKTPTLLETITKMAKEKFESPDAFKAWRIDNDLPENLTKLKDQSMDMAKVWTAVREFKGAAK